MTIKTNRDFTQAMNVEISSADQCHGKYNSFHEAYSVILEELDEFWEIVRQKSADRDRQNAYAELVQIATACMRAARDLDLQSRD